MEDEKLGTQPPQKRMKEKGVIAITQGKNKGQNKP